MKIETNERMLPPINDKGLALIKKCVALDYNEVARKYGAPPLPHNWDEVIDSRFKLRSASEVIQTEPIRWRIKGVIPEQGIGAIYGPSGSAKTFLALDLAMSVASGSRWFGYKVNRCSVAYVYLEGEAGLSVRLRAYAQKGDIPKGIDFIDQPLNLLDPKDIKELIEVLRFDGFSHGIIILDTLNRAAPGLDENSSVDMGKAISAVKAIQQALGGLVLMVHHTGKDATKGLRGHSSLHAALDAAIEVRRSGDQREWSVAKAKDGADGVCHAFNLRVVDMGSDHDGDPITSCLIEPAMEKSPIRSKALSAAQQFGMDTFMAAASKNITGGDLTVRAHIDEWRDEYYQRSAAENAESKRRAFNRARKDLINLGKLVVTNDVYRLPNEFFSE